MFNKISYFIFLINLSLLLSCRGDKKVAINQIDFLLDGVVYNHVENEHKSIDEWPFDQNFHLKLNAAIGGRLGGIKGIDDSVFPQKMFIDYVRVLQLKLVK